MTKRSKLTRMIILMAVIAIACAIAWRRGSASASAPGPVVAVVNIQEAIVATNEGKKEFDVLQTRFAPKQNQLKADNDEVERLKKELQQGTFTETEKTARTSALATKQKSLQRNYEDAQAEFQQAEQEVVNRLGAKMLKILDEYAKANGISIVLDTSNAQTPVLYAGPEAGITKQIVDAYNTQAK